MIETTSAPTTVPKSAPSSSPPGTPSHFIRAIVEADNASGRYGGRVVTRFPPEPNGYPHIGHAKSITLNFGLAAEFGGRCHLRYDDTNPETEDPEYVAAIERDVRWLGFDPGPHIYFASDYYPQLYAYAQELVRRGRAYVCSLSEEEIRATRGTVTEPGTPSPYRSRPILESLDLLDRMRRGELPEGAHTLRASIDMTSPNMKMRDPLLYRIKHTPHYRSGDAWHIYPFYDFAHCLSDAIEGITHSLCTLEFENNRELYDWILAALDVPTPPQQIEFARLSLNHVVVSKRKLLKLVEGGYVRGWDDPRLPTLSGLRRKGVRPEAIRLFCEKVGVARANSSVGLELLDHCIREDLDPLSPRRMAVLNPLRVVITDWPEGVGVAFDAKEFPPEYGKWEPVPFVAGAHSMHGARAVPMSGVVYIDREDFAEDPPKGFFRLQPGGEVRLRYGPVIRCVEVVKDAAGTIVELHATHDPGSFHGQTSDGRKVKGIVHWVDGAQGVPAEFRLYDRLFDAAQPGDDFLTELNPRSLVVCQGFVEPSLGGEGAAVGQRYQFERVGYFAADPDGTPVRPVFNRVVPLKDTRKASDGRPSAAAAAEINATDLARKAAASSAEAQVEDHRSVEARTRSPEEAALVGLGVGAEDARVLAGDLSLLQFYEEAAAGRDIRAVATFVVNQLRPELGGKSPLDLPFSASALGELVAMIESGRLSTPLGRKVLAVMLARGGSPEAIAAAEGLLPLDDAALGPLVDGVIASNPAQVARYRGGQAQLFGFFVGQVLKASGGRADPAVVQRVLRERLG